MLSLADEGHPGGKRSGKAIDLLCQVQGFESRSKRRERENREEKFFKWKLLKNWNGFLMNIDTLSPKAGDVKG